MYVKTKVTGVSVQDVLSGLRRKSQNRCVDEWIAQSVESCRTDRTDRIPNKWDILPRQGHHGSCNIGKILYKPLVIAEKKQLANTLKAIWNRPRLDVLNLHLVAFQATSTDNMSQERYRRLDEMTLHRTIRPQDRSLSNIKVRLFNASLKVYPKEIISSK